MRLTRRQKQPEPVPAAEPVTPPTGPSAEVRRGGWHGPALYEHMSPFVARRMASADAEFERERQREAAVREHRVAVLQARATQASIEAASARGEQFSIREAYDRGGVGHTPGEFLALMSAEQDYADAMENARRAARPDLTDLGWSEMHSTADLTEEEELAHPMSNAGRARAEEESRRRAEQVEAGREIQTDKRRAREVVRPVEQRVDRLAEVLAERGMLA